MRGRSSERRFVPIEDARAIDEPWPAMAWPPSPATVLTGKGLDLRPVDPARDAAGLFHALDHDAVWRHLPARPGGVEEYRDALGSQVAAGRLPWVLRLRRPCGGHPAGSIVGTSSYLDVAPVDARLEIGSTAYTPSVWASAVNPEAKLLLLGYAFDTLGAGRVQLKTDVRNTRSQEAIARLGAAYEGTLRRYQRRRDGTVRDTVLFSILAEEWPRVRTALEARLATGD